MVVETAVVTLTVKALVGIICGSAGGGLLVGGTAAYVISRKIHTSKPEIQREYEKIDQEAAFRTKKRQQSLKSSYSRVASISEETMSAIANNEKRASSAIAGLEKTIDSAAKYQQAGHVLIDATMQENQVIQQLIAELKAKNEQLSRVTTDYDELKRKFTVAVSKFEQALIELEMTKRSINELGGERDYAALVIEKIKRLKFSNAQLKRSLDIQTEKYQKAEQQIVVMTEHLQLAKSTILAQEKIISDLQTEVAETVPTMGQSSQSNLRFF